MSFPRKENPEDPKEKSLSAAEAKGKILAYCAYQERCQKEVRIKLYDYGLNAREVESLITFLILEGFLNEERFAKSFARGKFRLKRWGKMRIRNELKNRMINENCLKSALKEIDDKEYWETLNYLAEKQWVKIKDHDPLIKKMKLYQYLTYKGFESDMVEEAYQKLTGTL